jgi:membrane-bound lytic murein transglycosylase F
VPERKPQFPPTPGVRLAAPLVALALALTSCQPQAPPPPSNRPAAAGNALVAIVRPAPGAWYIGPQDAPLGFEHDLLARFASENHRELRAVTAESATDLVRKVGRGDAQVGLGGLYRPDTPARTARRNAHAKFDPDKEVLWTRGITFVEPVLVYNADGFKPKSWSDLAGAEVAYLRNTGVELGFAKIRAEHPDIRWTPLDLASADALIAQVDDASIDYAVVTSADVALARNVHLSFDVAFPAGARRELAWAVPAGQAKLRDQLDAYIDRARRDGTLAQLLERYFAPAKNLDRPDAGALHDRIETVLPGLRKYFQRAQDESGLDWRLLAAIAYQESQWDPDATSETGVRGIMQITEDTAKQVGLGNRLDAETSITAAARYLRTLRDKLPKRITEPDRTWMMLAAFNIGLGHLEDARVLAQRMKGNPDLWSDVRKALPLLAEPEYFGQAKLGYARGGMPVAFVQRVRSYYDILARSLPPHAPRLRNLALGPLASP